MAVDLERRTPEGMLPPPATGALGSVVRAAFRVASGIRSARAFHPQGSLWQGTFEVLHPLPGDHAFARRRSVPALARFSFGAGLPRPVPDFHGVAFRLVDAYGPGQPQDVLVVSSLGPPVLRHLLLPVPRGRRARHSSILPYRTEDGRSVLFGARMVRVPALDPYGAAPFDVAVSSLLGPWRPCGRFHIDEPADDDTAAVTHFDPWNTAPGLRPWGFLNALRFPAYVGSRRGRHARLDTAPGVAGRETPKTEDGSTSG